MDIGKIIKAYREKNGITMQEFSDASGISKAYISMLEKGKHPQHGKPINPSYEVIEKAARAMGVSVNELTKGGHYKRPAQFEKEDYIRIPVLGRVAAGIPIEQIEDIEDYEEMKAPVNSDKEFFALRIRGDSMQPKIWDGSIVIAERQNDAETGDIVIASINGDDAVCKQLKYFQGGIMLISLNPAYEPIIIEEGDWDTAPVRILGKVIEVRTPI